MNIDRDYLYNVILESQNKKNYNYNELKELSYNSLKQIADMEAKNDINRYIEIIKQGKFTFEGELWGMGKTGRCELDYNTNNALKNIRSIIGILPEHKKHLNDEIIELLEGKPYEDVFDRLNSITAF